MQKTAYIAVEAKSRELQSRVLVATKLASKGWKAIIAPHYKARQMAAKYEGSILIDKDGSHRLRPIYEQIKKNHGKIYIIDEEWIIPSPIEEDYKSRYCDEDGDLIDKFFLTGDYWKDVLQMFFPKSASKFCVTGNPRIDLLSNELCNNYLLESQKIREIYGNFILVNSNLVPFAESDFDLIEGNSGQKLSMETRRVYNAFNEDIIGTKRAYIETIKKISKMLDVNIIVRPHPNEDEQSWREALEECKNVIVTKEGKTNSWIMASSVMLHYGCTTALEAYLMHKKSIYYSPLKNLQFENKLLTEISTYVDNEDELLMLVQDTSSGFFSDDQYFDIKKEKELEKYIYIPKDGTITENITKIIEDDNSGLQAADGYQLNFDDLYEMIKQILLLFFKKKKHIGKFDYTTRKEICDLVEKSKRLFGITDTIAVRKCGINLFVLEQK